MASQLPDIEARMRAQEFLSSLAQSQTQKLERDKAEKSEVAELSKDINGLGQSVAEHFSNLEASIDVRFAQQKAEMEKGFADLRAEIAAQFAQARAETDDRFKHTDGHLADLQANTIQIRDLLARLVDQQK